MTTPPDHILALLEVEIYDGVRRPLPPGMMIPIQEPAITAAIDWDPLLHPRGRDGKFIEVGGWVRGLFDFIDGDDRKTVRAKVTKVSKNPGFPDNPRVFGITDDGAEVVTTVDKINEAAPTKADLSPSTEVDFLSQIQTMRAEFSELVASGALNAGGARPTVRLAEAEILSTQIGHLMDDEIVRRTKADGAILYDEDEFKRLEKAAKVRVKEAMLDRIYENGWRDEGLIAAKEDLNNLRGGRDFYRRKYASNARAVLYEILGKEGMGGTVDFDGSALAETDRAELAESLLWGVEDFFPTSWIKKSNDLDTKLKPGRGYDPRAYYAPASGRMRFYEFTDEQTVTHEMVHRVEHAVPAIRMMEFAFYWRRVGDEEPLALNYLYGTNKFEMFEVARPDEFPTAYMGKDYGGGSTDSWELLSMGVEHLFTLTHGGETPGFDKIIGPDKDFRAFTLGVLANIDADASVVGDDSQGTLFANPVYEEVMQRTQRDGGATTFVGSNKHGPVTAGKAVSIFPERSVQLAVGSDEGETADAVEAYRDQNSDLLDGDDYALGTWVDKESGILWLDVVAVVATSEEARSLAIEHNQIAYFDLDIGEEVRTGGTGEATEEGPDGLGQANLIP